MAYGEGRNPEVVIRQDLAALVQMVLQLGIGGGCLVVERKNEGCLKTALESIGPLFSPASPQGSKQQLTDRDEGKRGYATFHVAEIRLAAWVARHHQI